MNGRSRNQFLFGAVLAACYACAGGAAAQDGDAGGIDGIRWTELQKVELVDAPGKHEILGIAEIAPGATAEMHIHEDYEVGYVLEGEFLLKTRGEPDRMVRAGESFRILPKKAHAATNTGKLPMKVLVTYIVDTDKPLAEPPPDGQDPGALRVPHDHLNPCDESSGHRATAFEDAAQRPDASTGATR